MLGKIVKALKLKTPFRGDVPGKDRFASFQKWHPEQVLQKPEPNLNQRLYAINTAVEVDHFAKVNDVISSSDIPPICIWNCDEAGFQFQHKPSLVCAKKVQK